MTARARTARISLLKWRLSRVPFIGYLGCIAACWCVFRATDQHYATYGSTSEWAWVGAALGLLALPIPLSMRLRDAGISPYIIAPLLLVFLFILLFTAFQLMGAMASVSGAPGANYDPATLSDRIQEYTIKTVLGLFAATTLFGVLAPSQMFATKTGAAP